ncbi:hypothetical protein [Nannocystis punicea]|uniref:Flp pilus-assembly TadG-like N-terminal domain-containing protein n=1 Tax=Nannocystis punicea TaxID=2995304 RepID=A0ABY7GV57_9BACT|nr:hypothetical protein [Nannocystis poenicansa]WAS90805.1 hypothetical protein O0S08_31845 [Nannocystis poenicansa]
MSFRSPRPSVRGFSSGALFATLALFFALYGTILNIAEASRALAASKESLANSKRVAVAALDHRRDPATHSRTRIARWCDAPDAAPATSSAAHLDCLGEPPRGAGRNVAIRTASYTPEDRGQRLR